MLHAVIGDQDFQETYWPMVAAVRQLMAACEGSGEIDPGTKPEDFLHLLGFLWQIPPTKEGEARVNRLLELMFRGLGAKDAAIARSGACLP